MIKGYELEETGFGIAPFICDNEHPILEVNVDEQEITLLEDNYCRTGKWLFEEFINIDTEKEWREREK